MKKKTIFKLLLDIVMTVLYLLLMFADGAGEFFHEAAGIAAGILFVIHVTLNWKQYTGIGRSVRSGKAKNRLVFKYAIDLLLPVFMFIVIVTGALISVALFDFGIKKGWMAIFHIHNIGSYFCLGLLALHIADHAKYLINVGGMAIKNWHDSNVRKTAGRFAAGLLVVFFVYTLLFNSYRDGVTASLAASPVIISDESNSGDSASDRQTDSSDTGVGADEDAYTADKDDRDSSGTVSDTNAAVVTLNEFLSKLYCTGCHNHCPLSSPLCARSTEQVESATAEYYELYGDE